MKRVFGLFWVLFILYFIFAHPAIIYYSTDFRKNLNEIDPSSALLNLCLSAVLWAFVFLFTLNLLVRYYIVAPARVQWLEREGKRLEAVIVEPKSSGLPEKKAGSKVLTLELNNLMGERVWHEMQVNDSDRDTRYEPGKKVYLRLDETFRKPPYFTLEGNVSRKRPVYILLWCMFVAGVLYYYNFSYDLESNGYGWRFLTLGHPLIVSAACLVFFSAVIYLVLKYLIFAKLNIGKSNDILKFRGKRAMARIISFRQTGTYINEQPEVRFELEFEAGHQMRRSAITKIVSLLDIGQIRAESEKMVFYDPEHPDTVLFEEDVTQFNYV